MKLIEELNRVAIKNDWDDFNDLVFHCTNERSILTAIEEVDELGIIEKLEKRVRLLESKISKLRAKL